MNVDTFVSLVPIELMNFYLSLCLSIVTPYSFPIPEFNRGNSAATSGKGHVKSASVSSPGPSADTTTTTTDPLRQRYSFYCDIKNGFC